MFAAVPTGSTPREPTMTVTSATAATWSSQAAWSRLEGHRTKLASDLASGDVSAAALTADRANVVNAAAEVARIEAARAADIARIRGSHATIDFFV